MNPRRPSDARAPHQADAKTDAGRDGLPAPAPADDGVGPDVLDDGQEEVFAYGAVVRGLVEDPKALGPEDLARAPMSPGRLTDR